MSFDDAQARELLREMFDAAVLAADPLKVVPENLPEPPVGRVAVVGAGKASAAMAKGVEQAWPGVDLSGIVVTRYGYEVGCERIEIVGASHPVPDAAGRAAAQRILDLARSLGPDDLMLTLISGGGSALLSLPAGGLTLEDKQAVNTALLRSGANIHEMNCVRKHLSAIKGGRLAEAAGPARVTTLLISDVPGDDPATIASGPTVPDPTTFAEALAIVEKYRIQLPDAVRRHLEAAEHETPKPGDAIFERCETVFAAKPAKSLEAAKRIAGQAGFQVLDLGDRLEGEARELGAVHADLAKAIRRGDGPAKAPCIVLSGGETTVTLSGHGRGGRNTEYLLGMAAALDGEPGVWAVAGDTDGIDGSEDNAGAVITPTTLGRAADAGTAAAAKLAENDAWGFFEACGDLLVTGPTFTNVNDFRAVLVVGD